MQLLPLRRATPSQCSVIEPNASLISRHVDIQKEAYERFFFNTILSIWNGDSRFAVKRTAPAVRLISTRVVTRLIRIGIFNHSTFKLVHFQLVFRSAYACERLELA